MPFIVAGYGYALWSRPLLVAGGTVAVGGFMALERLRSKRSLRQLAASREAESICTFSRAFDRRLADTWVIRAVYEEVQGHLRGEYPSFPLRPSDRLATDLHIDPEDLEMDLARDIAYRSGRSLDDAPRNPFYGRVHTVGDLVEFFSSQPKRAGEQGDEADKATHR